MLKPVSILFADVVGSTARAEQMHAEDIRELMADFFAAMTAEIRAEGGRIEKFMGDAVMAVFGVPQAHEDDPIRAVRAARRMFARLADWNEGREELHKIKIRIGVNTGGVLAAAPGADLEITGDPVNVAARLEQAAGAGNILIGERTARAVRGLFVLTPSEPLELKGKAEPMIAYLVGEERTATQRRGLLGRRSPLIGRALELRELSDALAEATSSSEPRLVTLVGEAGLGKSRLVEEFTTEIQGSARVVSGRCLPYGEGVTLWPLAEILMAEAGILLTDPPEVTSERILKLVRTQLQGAGADGDEEHLAAILESTLGSSELADRLADLDPRERFKELLEAWRSFFGTLAGEGPIVSVIDDIHWADETMFAILEDLVANLDGAVLFICPTRPDVFLTERPWLESHPRTRRIDLAPLDSDASNDLIAGLFGSLQMPEHLRGRILERAEGNPLFIEEILQAMIDDGHLHPVGEGWALASDVEIEIPDNVQGVLLARLDRLDGETKKVLQTAAVVGRTFWVGALLDVSKRAEELLADLEERQLVYKNSGTSMAGQVEYTFKHILVRDVAYETLPRKRRARHHVHVANWIKEVSGRRSDELAELLGHHFHQAFTYSKDDAHRLEARAMYEIAARSACQRFAIRQSETYGWLVVDLSTDGDERLEALETLGDLFCMVGGMDGAWKVYTDALGERAAEDTSTSARLAAKAAIVATRFENVMRARLSAETVNEVIDTGMSAVADEESEELSMLLASKAIMQAVGYEPLDEAGETAAERALEVAEKVGDADTISVAIDALTYRLLPRGLYGRINELAKRRIDLVPELSDLQEICDAYNVAAWSAAFIGRFEEGEVNATDCIERARGADAGNYIGGLVVRVRCRFMLGDWEGALSDQSEIERLEAEQDRDLPPPYLWQSYAIAAGCRRLRGDDSEADRYLSIMGRVIDDAPSATEKPTLFSALLARAHLYGGDIDAAEALINLEDGTALSSHLEAACHLSLLRDDAIFAGEIAARAREVAAQGGLVALPLFAARCEGWALRNENPKEACELLDRAAAGFEELSAPWEEAITRIHLADVLWGLGDDRSAAEAERAASLFEALGAVSHETRTDGSLTPPRERGGP